MARVRQSVVWPGQAGPASGRRLAVWVLAGWAALAASMSWLALWSAAGLIVIPALTFLAFAGLMTLLAWRSARVGKAKSKLDKLSHTVTPSTQGPIASPAHQVEVHMVASEEPGAGRALLAGVSLEADRNGWALSWTPPTIGSPPTTEAWGSCRSGGRGHAFRRTGNEDGPPTLGRRGARHSGPCTPWRSGVIDGLG